MTEKAVRPLIIRGDARSLPFVDESVDLIVTSPPYFGQRSYKDGGEHYGGQLGDEATVDAFLTQLWACTAEMVRVLKRLYPSNPDIVLGREARNIVAALSDAGFDIVKRPIGPDTPPVAGRARTVEISDRTGRTDPDVP